MTEQTTPKSPLDTDEAKTRFAEDLEQLRDNLESRFHQHLEDGQPVAAMEARLLARLIETREFEAAKRWAVEYQGSLDDGH
ncbi:hypothetical protein HKX54_02190 [Sulfitobacter sp. M57]|uniref:hypothetical protein n=1 Tax=unclassified Sulfitobacter TaxID=196795 RepID=UPI0023E0F131|nr:MULTISPECIES: hypothetical protein [unclassified Sulfitobacter]MDF3413250.1 hypothetical protein [Sulfitobacter sp. KE5]MDF3421468.1 hypothetical protein [Sulfitobacter sp. KE43]MDF3431798.1 hypothetical protein [Sulfitobacter sp. KE42]MDF3457438.1 hypothetical protein [Sulfitobacter sp. S74]MDF3461341.1 hypothetical protein [Sulfitobacter sp. Ks18]